MHISQLKNQISQLIERSSYLYVCVYKFDHVVHMYILRSHMRRYKTKLANESHFTELSEDSSTLYERWQDYIFKPVALRRGLLKRGVRNRFTQISLYKNH